LLYRNRTTTTLMREEQEAMRAEETVARAAKLTAREPRAVVSCRGGRVRAAHASPNPACRTSNPAGPETASCPRSAPHLHTHPYVAHNSRSSGHTTAYRPSAALPSSATHRP